MEYRRMDPMSLNEPGDHDLFQALALHVETHFEGDYLAPTDARIDGFPAAVRTSWLLWCFASEVAGNGLPDYLLNHCSSAAEARAYLQALKAVGAIELVEQFEICIPLALEADGELAYAVDAEWFRGFPKKPDCPEIEAFADRSMELAAEPLSSLVAEHIRAAAGEI